VEDDGQTVWFREPSGRLGGAFRGDLVAAGPGPILYVSVGDADTALHRIKECGGTVVQERTMIAPGFGYRAVFQDPAGTTMGLFEPGS
jgi:predicted enzyme related to lactoylglutathione lyase